MGGRGDDDHVVSLLRRTARAVLTARNFSSSTTHEIPTLYSFLQPSIFALNRPTISQQQQQQPPPQIQSSSNNNNNSLLSSDQITSLESTLHSSLAAHNTDEAWKSFKILTSNSTFPSKHLSNSLITHLSALKDIHNLKRAFATVVFLLEKSPQSVSFEAIGALLEAIKSANTAAPAFALIKSMFKNRFFPPFSLWGDVLIEISRKSGSFAEFLGVFSDNCRIALDEKLGFMKPNLAACNAALEGCCCYLESVSDADRVVETMSILGVRPNELSFGFLAYLYALKGLEEKIDELGRLMDGLGEETYAKVVKGFLQDGSIKDLAKVITESQKLESSLIETNNSVGFGIVNACVNLGLLDKAHSILDEMKAEGSFVGLGVYVSILKAYCKEFRTAEAANLVMEISASGLHLDSGSYDSLIEASMSNQDFQSAFSLFRDMREARTPDLQVSYLTIMTGLTENNRPELMAAFLDEVVEDPRIKVRKRLSNDTGIVLNFDHNLVDAFLYALVKGGYFDAVMQVMQKSQDMKIFVDKWRYKQAFMETHKKLKIAKLRRRSLRKMEAVIAFKNWAGLNAGS
ncbi:hypothetical protein Sjap_015429 [Stephania japonica]|uniref:At1g68980-like TPR repeats domain-containing protein n=1 Tax=Stephania japonica TaxID=461633 RepID=A0AAP0NQT7_9MAGN